MAEKRTSYDASVFEAPLKGANGRRGIGKVIARDDRSNEETVQKNTNARTSRIAQSERNVTPPMARSTLLIPMAPVKQRKQFDKEVLKPKKLIYSDRENECIDEDGGGTTVTPVKKQKERIRNGGKRTGLERSSKKRSDSCDASANVRGTDDDGSIKTDARGKKGGDLVRRGARPSIKKSSTNRERSLKVDKENADTLVEGNGEETKDQVLDGSGKGRNFRRDYFLRNNSKTFLSHLVDQDDLQSKRSANVRDCKQELKLYDVPLSQPTENMNWLDRLRWLQPLRDVGLWIQCCRSKCAKWRYTEEYRDPLDVPKKWYCCMNSDKSLASCDAPETQLTVSQSNDLIENAYNAGSIVWARVNGFPWWPAMVDDCPDTAKYYWISSNSRIPIKYHVIFFEEPIMHNWLRCKDIKPFVGNDKDSIVKRTMYRGIDYAKQLDMACKQAWTAVPLSILQRLQKFGVLTRYTSLFNDDSHNNNTVATKLLCTDALERVNVPTKPKKSTSVSKSKESNILRIDYKSSQEMDDTCSIHSSILYDSSCTSYQALPTVDKTTDRRLLKESKKETSMDDIRRLSYDIFTDKMKRSQSKSVSGTRNKLTSLTKRTIRENDAGNNVGKESDDCSAVQLTLEQSSEDEIPSSQCNTEPSQLFLKLSNVRHNSLKLQEKHVPQTTSFHLIEATVSGGIEQMENEQTKGSCKKYKRRTLPGTNCLKMEGTKVHTEPVIDRTVQVSRKRMKLIADTTTTST